MGSIVKAIGNIVGAVLGGGAPKADGGAATGQVDTAAANAAKARSQLLETAGASAGSPLQPGQVAKPDTVFGN